MTPFYFTSVSGTRAYLDDEEARHCIKVMRHRPGERVIGVDGRGNMLLCRILETGRDHVELEILERHPEWGEKPLQIVLGMSVLHKPDRFEWMVEKAVELGVNCIVPYVSKHTVKTGVRLDRMERIMQAALKQCMRSRLPQMEEAVDFERALELLDSEVKLVAHIQGERLGEGRLAGIGSVGILIGPEGDFAEEELELAGAKGFIPIALGENRLRSETAAIHLLGVVKHLAGY